MKKIVFLPYDFDTAIGINNEGSLTFSYNLEDIDTIEGGADVYNGQQSVLWVNMRSAFYDDIKEMYQQLRSDGELSYEVVERMFEEHQSKWPEAIFNEDAYFKYIRPLIDDGSGVYLPMLQGSKSEQRKWWLYNRFRYLDSKYNAGDALTDVIQIRGYAKDNITVTPYADVYPSIKYGSYLVQTRGQRNVPTTLICPLDNVNDTEIYIYSASQLSSVGDLSGFKVGFADFHFATRLQNIKLGDSSSSYTNTNLTSLTLGNNTLLQTIDVRNCPNLTQSIDISGCTNIEEIYFDGTSITGITLPVGGILRVLHLPSTVINLTIRNQPSITDFTMPDYSGITTLRLENVSSAVPIFNILENIQPSSRVRLLKFNTNMSSMDDVDDFCDDLDTMKGIDENGNNVENAVVQGTINVPYAQDTRIEEVKARYNEIAIAADLKIDTLNVTNNGTYTAEEGHAYSPVNVNVYVIGPDEIAMGAPGGEVILHCNTIGDYAFAGRNITSVYSDTVDNIGGNVFAYCPNTVKLHLTNLALIDYYDNSNKTFGSRISEAILPNLTSLGAHVFRDSTNLTNLYIPNLQKIKCTYTFYNCSKLTSFHTNAVSWSGSMDYTFYGCSKLVTVVMPKYNSYINSAAFDNCYALTAIDMGAITRIAGNGGTVHNFQNCNKLETIIIRKTDAICTLSDASDINFKSSPFASTGTGGTLYVPQALVESYQNATNWSTLLSHNQILPIEGSEYEHYYADGTPIEEE